MYPPALSRQDAREWCEPELVSPLDDEQLDAEIVHATIVTENRVHRALIHRHRTIELPGFVSRRNLEARTRAGSLARWKAAPTSDDFLLYRAPLVRLIQFTRQTADGVWHDMAPEEFHTIKGAWPMLRRTGNAWPPATLVRVEFVSGYASCPAELPGPMRLAVLHQLEAQLLEGCGRSADWNRVHKVTAAVNWNDFP